MKQATLPAIIALTATSAMSLRRDGAMAPSPPSWMPMAPTLLKPHRAYVDIATERFYECTRTHNRLRPTYTVSGSTEIN